MSIEAMKQALEALENTYALRDDVIAAKASLRQAIAEAEQQEPVAMQMDVIVVNLVRESINKHRARELAEHFIKHTHPQPNHIPDATKMVEQEREPLTDEQIEEIVSSLTVSSDGYIRFSASLRQFARAIEAAHGIKGEA
jgi:hypothetical protein